MKPLVFSCCDDCADYSAEYHCKKTPVSGKPHARGRSVWLGRVWKEDKLEAWPTSLLARFKGDWQAFVNGRVGAWDNMNADQLADATCSSGPGIGCRFDRGYVAANYRGNKAGANLFIANQRNIGRLDHRVGRLDHRDQSFGLDHSESFHLFSFHLSRDAKLSQPLAVPRRASCSMSILSSHLNNNSGPQEGLVPAALGIGTTKFHSALHCLSDHKGPEPAILICWYLPPQTESPILPVSLSRHQLCGFGYQGGQFPLSQCHAFILDAALINDAVRSLA